MMFNPPVPSASADLIHYNPVKGLKVIATTSAAEKFWAQAKDTRQLFQAVKAKLLAQAEYVVWRDSVVHHGGDHKSGSRLQPCNLVLPKADPGAVQISRWRSRLCVKTTTGTRIDTTKLAAELELAQIRCVQICEGGRPVHGAQGTGEIERNTPRKYIETVRRVLGGIDCDPASNFTAQKIVQAGTFYTLADNGLLHPWYGRTFLNGPYDDLLPWVGKLLQRNRNRSCAICHYADQCGD